MVVKCRCNSSNYAKKLGIVLSCLAFVGCHSIEREQLATANSEQAGAAKASEGEVSMAQKKIRPAALAGTWYSKNPEELNQSIHGYLSEKQPVIKDALQAIVVPHAGHIWSGSVAASGWREVQNRKYKRVFILCPNHRVMLNGVAVDKADAFDTPLGPIDVDTTFRDELVNEGIAQFVPTAFNSEHAIEIQLPFMKIVAPDAVLVPMIVGHLSEKLTQKLAAKLRANLKEDDLLVISSDFLHYGEDYGFVPFEPNEQKIRNYDDATFEAIKAMDAERFSEFAADNSHAACGINPLRVLEYTFDSTDAQVDRLDYGTSGRQTDDFTRSVSYQAIVVTQANAAKLREGAQKLIERIQQPSGPVVVLNEEAQQKAHALIRLAIKQAVESGHETPFVPSDIVSELGTFPKVFDKMYGVFVTLHEDGQLRGCIGNIVPYQSLMLGLWGRAQDAALNDPRFDAVTPDELPRLDYEISVLTPPEPIGGPNDIIIGRHGVILSKNGRQAVFLPQVAPEQGWNVEQMLTALSMKAGLSRDAWREGARFSVIEAQVF